MTREATREALERLLEDEEARKAVAAGSTDAIEDLDLSEEERAMLVAAADDFPEVAGFAAGLSGLSSFKVGPSTQLPSSWNKILELDDKHY